MQCAGGIGDQPVGNGNIQEGGIRLCSFGKVEYVTLADVSGEYAFLTEKLTEGAFEEKSKQVDMIMRIRTAL